VEGFMVIKGESNFFDVSRNSPFRLSLGILFLVLIIALPSGVPALFDGLPWTGRFESLVVVIFIPFLLILGWKFLSIRICTILLALVLGFKVFAFIVFPSGGLLIKVKPSFPSEKLYWNAGYCQYVKFDSSGNPSPANRVPDNCEHHQSFSYKEGGWVETFATIWNQDASGILTKPWTRKREFPLDWTIRFPIEEFDNLNPTLLIEGTLILPKGNKFALVAEGLEGGNLIAKNIDNQSFILQPAKNLEEATLQQYQLPIGERWQISGEIEYSGKDWSLIPLLVGENGQVSSSLGRDTLWQGDSVFFMSTGKIQFYKYLSWVVDISICVFFLIWAFWTARFQIQEQVLTLPLALFSFFAASLPIVLSSQLAYILNLVHMPDYTTVSHLGIFTTITGAGFLLWSYFREDYRCFKPDRIGRTILMLFGPAMLFFFVGRWWLEIGQWTWAYIVPNDWDSYQYFARRIIVGGQWLDGGESALMGREFYPYVVAILHGLFGQTVFAQHMLDAWSVLGASVLLALLAIKFRLSSFTAYITSIAFLMAYLIGSFRYHIGRSMSETTAMIFMLLTAWFLFKAREGGVTRIVLATIFGVLGYWSRQDHLGVIAGLAFLYLEPVTGARGGWMKYWERFKYNWRVVAIYWAGGLFFGVFLLCLRNWFIGVGFRLSGPSPNFGDSDLIMLLKSFYLLLTGNMWPHFPSIAGLVISFGTLVAVMSLVMRGKLFLSFPISIGVSILGLLVPYLLVKIWSYPPRFSIHLLPLALLSLMVFFNNFFKDHPIISKFDAKS
jgi:hypothetical protein